MTSVVGTAILNLIQKKIIGTYFTRHIAVLPGFVKQVSGVNRLSGY